jgi:septal ring factor EnvC (AmiA/AmiB activator)
MNSSIILVLLASICFGFSEAEDSEQGCATMAKCLQEAYDCRKSCDATQAQITKQWPVNETAAQKAIDTELANYNNMTYSQRMEKINCLKASLNKTVVATCDATQKANCAKYIAAYKPKVKRQAVPTPPTTPSLAQLGQEIAAEQAKVKADQAAEDALVKEQKMEQAQMTTTLPSIAQLQKEIADQQNKIKADQLTEATLAKDLTTEQQQAAAADKANHDKMTKSYNDCNTKAASIEAECAQLAPCCSEHPICDLAHQATAEYTNYVKLQSKLQLDRRAKTCPVPKPAPAPAPKPANVTSG